MGKKSCTCSSKDVIRRYLVTTCSGGIQCSLKFNQVHPGTVQGFLKHILSIQKKESSDKKHGRGEGEGGEGASIACLADFPQG